MDSSKQPLAIKPSAIQAKSSHGHHDRNHESEDPVDEKLLFDPLDVMRKLEKELEQMTFCCDLQRKFVIKQIADFKQAAAFQTARNSQVEAVNTRQADRIRRFQFDRRKEQVRFNRASKDNCDIVDCLKQENFDLRQALKAENDRFCGENEKLTKSSSELIRTTKLQCHESLREMEKHYRSALQYLYDLTKSIHAG